METSGKQPRRVKDILIFRGGQMQCFLFTAEERVFNFTYRTRRRQFSFSEIPTDMPDGRRGGRR